jgi:acyl-CoA thioesterase I
MPFLTKLEHDGRIVHGSRVREQGSLAALLQQMMQVRYIVAAVLALSVVSSVACGRESSTPAEAPPRVTPPPPSGGPAPSAHMEALDVRPRVVLLGDSITAGLGLSPEEAYPTLLQEKIDADGLAFHVINAGVSGDTSAGGLSRMDWALDGDVRVLVVALGGNDALRGLPVEELRKNLSTIIERAQAKRIRVILAGMEAPPNFGQAYIVAFHKIYPELSKKYGIPLIPFLLQGVAGIEGLNQRDGIHPTAEGARTVADNVWTVLRPTLKGS